MFTAIASNSIIPSLIMSLFLIAIAQPQVDKVATPLQTLADVAALQEEIEKLDGTFLVLREKVLQGVRQSSHLATWLVTEPANRSWDTYPPYDTFRSKGWAICGAAEEAVQVFNSTISRYRAVRDRLMKEAVCFDLAEINERELARPDETLCPTCGEPGARLVPEPQQEAPTTTTVMPDGTKVTQV